MKRYMTQRRRLTENDSNSRFQVYSVQYTGLLVWLRLLIELILTITQRRTASMNTMKE